MASISTLGVGSGLDLSSILDSLEAAEKSTLTPISKQQSSYTAKLSAYGTLKSALESFQTANTALNKADLFTATSTTSSSSAFSATTTGSAIAGKYTISVSQLAQAQTLTTKNSQKDSKAAIATSDSVLTINKAAVKIRSRLISARVTRHFPAFAMPLTTPKLVSAPVSSMWETANIVCPSPLTIRAAITL